MLVGLDIGRQFVKAVLLEKSKAGYKILETAIRPVSDPNKAYDPEQIKKPLWVMAIRELFRDLKLKPARVRGVTSGINSGNVSIKQISTMEMPTDELYSAMTFEARKHIPMDGTEAVIDFQIMGANDKEVDKIDVALVACTKKTLSQHIDILKESGLRPGKVDADPVALSNAFFVTRDLPEEGAIVILDIGTLGTTLIVRGGSDPFFTRDIPIGSHHFIREIADKQSVNYLTAQDKLYQSGVEAVRVEDTEGGNISVAERTVFDNMVEDIRRSLRYYAKTNNQSFFLKIFLSGGGAATGGLAEYIQEKLNVEVAVFNPLESFPGYEADTMLNPNQYAVATGLALRGGLEA